MSSTERSSAYQGRGWKPRRGGLGAELACDRGLWAPWRVGSEHRRLRAVLLYCPGAEMGSIRDPNSVQHLERMSPPALRKEFSRLAAVYRRLGVEVHHIPRAFCGGRWRPKHNLMFVRDLFFNTREGAVVSRMASSVRAGEEKHAALALSALGVPIVRTVSGRGLFEGADALWLDSRTVLCGTGNRTDAEGFRQVAGVLAQQGVKTLAVRMPEGVQHLLGLMQIVDRDLVLVRTALAPARLLSLLRARGFKVVPVPEGEETTRLQGMNVVMVAPKTLVMPDDCPGLERLYARTGIRVAAKVDIRHIRRGAGGLACATGILARDC